MLAAQPLRPALEDLDHAELVRRLRALGRSALSLIDIVEFGGITITELARQLPVPQPVLAERAAVDLEWLPAARAAIRQLAGEV